MSTIDVVIVGGGPAGAAVALELAQRGLSPVVFEARPAAQLKVGESLPPSINVLFDHFGLTERLRVRGSLPAHGNRFVWGSDSIRERDFIFGPDGDGWRLDRRMFEEELMQAAVAAGVRWLYSSRLNTCVKETTSWKLTTTSSDGVKTYSANFVVDATGRESHLARSFGANRVLYDRLIGLAVYFQQPGVNADSFTLVEAVGRGWWYSARLPDNKLIAVYMTDSDLLDRDARHRDGWLALLNEARNTTERVSSGTQQTRPRILPAHTVRLTKVAGDGWLAVGDAAIAFDPLASHGISMAMSSGLHAAAAIVDYLGGKRESLYAYERLIDASFAQYLLLRRETYLSEQRWPHEEFWRRRH